MIKHETRTSTKTHELTALFAIGLNAKLVCGTFDHKSLNKKNFSNDCRQAARILTTFVGPIFEEIWGLVLVSLG